MLTIAQFFVIAMDICGFDEIFAPAVSNMQPDGDVV